MHLPFRWSIRALVASAALFLTATSPLILFGLSQSAIPVVHAQGAEPTAIIDTVFRDLSAKVGQTLTRGNVQNFTWQQVQFKDSSLDCPQPGVSYAQVIVNGYQVIVTTRDGKAYDYRTNQDGSQILLCGTTQTVIATTPTAAAQISVPGSEPNVTAAPGAVITYTNPIAFIGADGNVYVTQATGGAVTPITGDAAGAAKDAFPFFAQNKLYENLRWSPDGSKLLFDDRLGQTLYVVQSGQAPKPILQKYSSQLPPTWTRDGQAIVYALLQPNAQPDANSQVAFSLNSIKLDGSPATTIGQIKFGLGCGGGGGSLLDLIYNSETSLNGNLTFLAATASGYIYSTECSGVGLSFLKTNGQPGWNHPELGRAALSPDGTQLIALQMSPTTAQPAGLVKVDAVTGTQSTLLIQPGLDQIGWSADGQFILYSTHQLLSQLPIPVSAQATGQKLFFNWPPDANDATVNTVTLWKLPIATGQPQAIYQTTGYAIPALSGLADNQNVAVSLIGTMKPVFDALTANQPIEQIKPLFPNPQIVRVPLNGSASTKLAQGGRPVATVGTFSAVAVAVQSVAVATVPTAIPVAPTVSGPPALVVGKNALVTATGAVLNVRDSPSSSGKIVQQLEYGMTVKIIGGPVIAGNLRWWQVQLSNGVIGWAIDQFTDSTGTTNTLTPQ